MTLEHSNIKIELPQASIALEMNGIVFIRIKQGAILDLVKIREINEAKNKLVDDRRHAVIFIAHESAVMTKEARNYSATDEVFKNAVCKAIVVKSTTHRIITNYFIHFLKPKAPVKMFNSEQKAIEWVLEKFKSEGLHF
jgi:hypothetical protein